MPIVRTLPTGRSLIFIKPGEAFSFYLNISLIGGLLLAAPFVTYQIWKLIAPGLYAKEKTFVIPFVALTSATESIICVARPTASSSSSVISSGCDTFTASCSEHEFQSDLNLPRVETGVYAFGLKK
jgi:hypothetical protein